MTTLAQRAFHVVCAKESQQAPTRYEEEFLASFRSMETFIGRYDGRLDFKGKRILDVGSGLGSPAILMAARGASRVVGVDIVPRNIDFARRKVSAVYDHLKEIVEFRLIRDFADLRDEQFDLIISKDSFEHYSDPEGFVPAMLEHLAPGGMLAVGFGPLWKSPYGGHIKYMTSLPWAHLVFSESVILRERERFFPDQRVKSYGDIVGGLNQMTLARFESIIAANHLEQVYFRANASRHPAAPVFSLASRLPFAREFLTFNLYGLWRAKSGRRAVGQSGS
jgi:SAM-dependent methyltransferase